MSQVNDKQGQNGGLDGAFSFIANALMKREYNGETITLDEVEYGPVSLLLHLEEELRTAREENERLRERVRSLEASNEQLREDAASMEMALDVALSQPHPAPPMPSEGRDYGDEHVEGEETK